MQIHPTAIVNPAAEIAEDVIIGPYVCINGPSIIGLGCKIQAHAIIDGIVRMGRDNLVGYGTVIGAEPQDHSFRPDIRSEVIIGDRNTFREYCTVHRGTNEGSATIVGNDNYLMVGTHLGHNAIVHDHTTMANNVLLGGHVEVGDHVFIGGGAVFHQFVRVGQLALTQGRSVITKDVPPFTLVAINSVVGINADGLRRIGFSLSERAEIKTAFRLLYREGLNTLQAIERARQMEWHDKGRLFFDFVATAKKRGICDVRKS